MLLEKQLTAIKQASRCLIVAPSWVGDMVMAQVLFKEIKALSPDISIDVMAPSWCAELTQYMSEVDQHIEAPFTHGKLGLKARWQTAKSLRGKYDIAFILPNSLKSALVPWLAKIPTRIGFLGEQRYGFLTHYLKLDKLALPTMCQRFSVLGKPFGDIPELNQVKAPLLKVSNSEAHSAAEKYELKFNVNQKIVALFPGAEFGASKQWPSEHYAAVARYFLDNQYAVWLFGSKSDQIACESINQQTDHRCVNLAGETSLSDAVCLISLADLAVSNDSGLMHVAAALEKPLVAIYGSTDPGFTPPMHSKAQIVRLDLKCSPCFKRECPLEHLDCLKLLKPNQVLDAAKLAMVRS